MKEQETTTAQEVGSAVVPSTPPRPTVAPPPFSPHTPVARTYAEVTAGVASRQARATETTPPGIAPATKEGSETANTLTAGTPSPRSARRSSGGVSDLAAEVRRMSTLLQEEDSKGQTDELLLWAQAEDVVTEEAEAERPQQQQPAEQQASCVAACELHLPSAQNVALVEADSPLSTIAPTKNVPERNTIAPMKLMQEKNAVAPEARADEPMEVEEQPPLATAISLPPPADDVPAAPTIAPTTRYTPAVAPTPTTTPPRKLPIVKSVAVKLPTRRQLLLEARPAQHLGIAIVGSFSDQQRRDEEDWEQTGTQTNPVPARVNELQSRRKKMHYQKDDYVRRLRRRRRYGFRHQGSQQIEYHREARARPWPYEATPQRSSCQCAPVALCLANQNGSQLTPPWTLAHSPALTAGRKATEHHPRIQPGERPARRSQSGEGRHREEDAKQRHRDRESRKERRLTRREIFDLVSSLRAVEPALMGCVLAAAFHPDEGK